MRVTLFVGVGRRQDEGNVNGLRSRAGVPGLDAARRQNEWAWIELRNAVAHFVLAARVTCGADAPGYARERLRAYVVELFDAEFDALADELVAEAAR